MWQKEVVIISSYSRDFSVVRRKFLRGLRAHKTITTNRSVNSNKKYGSTQSFFFSLHICRHSLPSLFVVMKAETSDSLFFVFVLKLFNSLYRFNVCICFCVRVCVCVLYRLSLAPLSASIIVCLPCFLAMPCQNNTIIEAAQRQ